MNKQTQKKQTQGVFKLFSKHTPQHLIIMGHSHYLGFSSGLMATLTDCRGKVESWVEREKRAADAMEEEYQQALAKEQAAVSALEENLLNIQFKLGITIKESARVGGEAAASPQGGSIAQRQQGLLQEKARLQAEIAELKHEREEKSEMVKSTYSNNFGFG